MHCRTITCKDEIGFQQGLRAKNSFLLLLMFNVWPRKCLRGNGMDGDRSMPSLWEGWPCRLSNNIKSYQIRVIIQTGSGQNGEAARLQNIAEINLPTKVRSSSAAAKSTYNLSQRDFTSATQAPAGQWRLPRSCFRRLLSWPSKMTGKNWKNVIRSQLAKCQRQTGW